MNAKRLLTLYDRVADAPDAIDRQRRFVLDLAVRGKLVKQDPADEPASELLERIDSARRLAPTKGRKTKGVAIPSSLADTAFSPPTGWAHTRLAQLVRVLNGRAYKKVELLDSGTPVLRVGNLFTSKHWYYSDLRLAEDKYCDEGDLLYAWSASFGPVIWQGPRAIFHYHIWKLSLFSEADLDKRFLYYFLLQQTQEIKSAGHGISMVHMTKGKMERLAVPVPPLAEQRRIVAKVDELMALCDRLDETRAAREDTRDRLTKASLARLTAPDTDEPTFRGHARFAIHALPALTARADQVKHLRQTILSLAVRGKLVEQDPTDEPASELLRRVTDERETLLRAKRIKRVRVKPIALGETPFRVPNNWEWTRLGHVGDWGAGSTPSRTNTEFFGGDVTWLKSGELNDNRHLLGSEETITQLALENCSFRTNRPGDILIAMYGATIGKLAILAESAVTNQAVCGCTPFQGVLSHFLFLYLLSRRSTFRRSSEGGAQPNISKVKIVATPFPLPPFAEQRRIVAKVDEIMTLCDRMEAVLKSLTAPAIACWKRFCTLKRFLTRRSARSLMGYEHAVTLQEITKE